MVYPKGTTEPKKSVASPAQMVAGKDFSNPLMAMDLPKVQQTQETVDFPINQIQQNNARQIEIWDTLGEPSGKFDYLVKYSPTDSVNPDSQTSPLIKGKEILQDSQDLEDDIISINRLLSHIQKLQEFPKNSRSTPKRKKKIVRKKREDVGEKFEKAINKALDRVFFLRKKTSKRKR
ncbi:PLAT domain-containing protein 1-like [Abeliophyllum distichum]|uniref:PLAT domain-containing protein 1-like n=1 Tax=Abeliophyllum distichum TaxID=126358 RepID=A0ABD1PS61_9LAMI